MQFAVSWLSSVMKKIQHSYNTVLRVLSPQTDIVGPTILYGFTGR